MSVMQRSAVTAVTQQACRQAKSTCWCRRRA
jgi:hypothetical protein